MFKENNFLNNTDQQTDQTENINNIENSQNTDNIENVDACITRLRVTVKDLSVVDSQALQNEGALGVIILGQQVHAIFGKQSDALRQLLDEHFAGNK